ncbi:MAG: sugar ABC transporter permease [Firmicutes bacterium]|nr:sugar ABC transporter permease [Bacillota bacterium]
MSVDGVATHAHPSAPGFPAGRRPGPWHPSRQERQEALAALAFLLPGLIWFLLWTAYPLLKSFWMSFFHWQILGGSTFAGLAHYARAFADPVIRTALENTLLYAVLSVPGQILFGFLVAALLDSITKGKVFFRVLYYIPVISSWVVVSLIFMYLFHSEGLMNYVLVDLTHFLPRHVPWLSQRGTALLVIALLGTWKGIGWSMLLFLAALQGIPSEVVEAASTDGAGGWQIATRVKLPLLRPMLMFQVVMLTIGAFQAFIQFYIMTGGGPMNQTQVFLTYMYKQAFDFYDFGYASAISFLLAAVILAISVVQMRFFRQDYEY